MSFNDRYRSENNQMRLFPLLRDLVLGLLVLVLLVAFWPLRSVPTGSRGVVTVGGAIKGIEGEGFTLIAPWQRLNIFNIRAEQADVKDADGATSDTQPVKTSLTVRYSISPDKVAEVFEKYSHDGNLNSYIHTATLETFKAVTARYTAPELIAKRPNVSADISSVLRAKVAIYGAQIINIDMTNFAFSASYMAAINEKVTQEQLRLGAENKLKTVEAEQKQKVAVAEAEANAKKATADGDAYAQLKVATAQAEALKVQNAALAQNRDVLELRRIEVEMVKASKWNGALPTSIYAGTPIPFFNPMATPAK
jgi:regulator of protease activity HflC (stomatin/prohibitin superfamily)